MYLPVAILLALATTAAVTPPAAAQSITGLSEPVHGKGHVTYAAEPVTLVSGHETFIDLRFRVDPGFHINSSRPSSDLLIPTLLTVEPSPSLRVLAEDYPRGTPFRLSVGDGETLDVYQGEFRVRLKLVAATRGDQTLNGTLRYQACDKAACFPPVTLPVRVPIAVR